MYAMYFVIIMYTCNCSFAGDVVLMGELSKYVPMSPQRVSSIEVTTADVTLTLEGALGEKVVMYYYATQLQVRSVTCVIGSTLQAKVSVRQQACYSF